MPIAESVLRQILECTCDCVLALDWQWHVTYLNPQAEEELGTCPDIIGSHILDVFPVLEETPFWPAYQQIMESGQAQCIEAYVPGFEAWYEARAAPTENGLAIFFYNIDKRKTREQRLQADEERLRRILDHIPHMVWTAPPDGPPDAFNRYWYEFTGLDQGSAAPVPGDDIFHPEDVGRVVLNWRKSTAAGEPYQDQYRLRHHSGEWRWVIARAWPETDQHGDIVLWHGTSTDIHEETIAKTALEQSELLYRSVLDASGDCIKIIDVDGSVQFMNEPGCRLMEIGDFNDIRGRQWADLWPERMRNAALAAIGQATSGKATRFSGLCPTAKSTPKWWDVVLTPMKDGSGAVTRLLSISRDITEDRDRAEQLKWASDHDALTGLPNRRAFGARLQAAVLRAMNSGSSIGLLLMDLDHFKHVNDTLGHSSGDELLQAFATQLQRGVRKADYVARLGGDEFAIIVEGLASERDLVAVGSSITARLQRPIKAGIHFVRASTSIGGALFPRDASTAADLMKCADTALYALKGEGRGGTRLFESDLRDEAERIASELVLGRAAVGERKIIPYYQPKLELASGRVVGFEALLRWMSPAGVQLPHTVAESFKNYELAASIGEIMQRQVVDDIASGRFGNSAAVSVSLNASPAEFLRDDYAERLLALLDSAGVPGSSLEVEVTEHVFFDRHSRLVGRALEKLHQHGVRIALDDFGTGYSSLSHLRDFPVDVLKIDMSFVQQICFNAEIKAIVSAVLELGRSLKIETVAEGIESEAQLQMLMTMGCDVGQGFYFGRPLPVQQIAARAALDLRAA